MGMTFAEFCKKAKMDTSEMKEIVGKYDEIKSYVMDAKGYFLIRVNRETNKIEVGFCPKPNKITYKIVGNTPQEIYFIAAELGLFSRYDHAAYLGKELEKAHLALKYNLEYVQDDDLCRAPQESLRPSGRS